MENDYYVKEFLTYLQDPEIAITVAAIKALTSVIKYSNTNTMMELEISLRKAADTLKCTYEETPRDQTSSSISLVAGCELLLRYVTRCFLEFDDFEKCKEQLIKRGEVFAETSLRSRNRIAQLGHGFVRDEMVIFVHGSSRVVSSLLLNAAKTKIFSVITTEGRPSTSGIHVAKKLGKAGIPITVIPDAAMGYFMEKADIVVVGAEAVVENGGIVNKIGTFSCAMAAKIMNKPFYVAAESYKFARLYPLNQSDLPNRIIKNDKSFLDNTMPENNTDGSIENNENITFENPGCDYTPHEFITLLITDLGVLTPSAVSDELIKLYQ